MEWEFFILLRTCGVCCVLDKLTLLLQKLFLSVSQEKTEDELSNGEGKTD